MLILQLVNGAQYSSAFQIFISTSITIWNRNNAFFAHFKMLF